MQALLTCCVSAHALVIAAVMMPSRASCMVWYAVCTPAKHRICCNILTGVQALQEQLDCGRCYVVGKDVAKRVVYVTEGEAGQDHPALLSNTALLHSPQWVAGDAPEQLGNGLALPCSFKARSALMCTPLASLPPWALTLPPPGGFSHREVLASDIIPGSVVFPFLHFCVMFILTHYFCLVLPYCWVLAVLCETGSTHKLQNTNAVNAKSVL